jgi:Zn-dependent peptidase ImmA (M78 family)
MSRKPNFQRAAKEAKSLLRKYKATTPPIDPERLAEEEGVRVLYAQFEPPADKDFSGFFRLKDKTIIVNDEISDNIITFTIAHELGHYFLHKEYIQSNNYTPMPRSNNYGGNKPEEEVEADTFAADLLVPLPILKKYKDVASIRELSELFFVSEEVIRRRLDLLERYPEFGR